MPIFEVSMAVGINYESEVEADSEAEALTKAMAEVESDGYKAVFISGKAVAQDFDGD